ncbi:tetratricopeptide repeat-containing sensor histidine kinase [Emticicia fontis]
MKNGSHLFLRFLLSGILLLLIPPAYAQSSKIQIPRFKQSRNGEQAYEDSLKRVGKQLEIALADKPQTWTYDSLRIALFWMMSEVYVDANRYNLDTASAYADQLYKYARKYDKKRLMMDALFRKEIRHNRLHEYSESLKLCFEAIDLCDQLGKDCGQRWKIEQIMGNVFMYSRDYANAEKYILQAFNSINDPASNVKTTLLINKGVLQGTLAKIYSRWKKNEEAEKAYMQQLEMMKSAKWELAIANANEELGDFYNSNGNSTKALPYFDEALRINFAKNNEEGIATVYNSIALANLNLNNNQKALEFAGKALAYSVRNKLVLLQPLTYDIIYQAQKALGNELEALRANQKYWQLKDSIDLKKRLIDLGDVRRLYELNQAKIQREKEKIIEDYRVNSMQKQYELASLKSEKLMQEYKLTAVSEELKKEEALATTEQLKIQAERQKHEQEKLHKQIKLNELGSKLTLEQQKRTSLGFIMGLISILGIFAIIYSLVLQKKNKQLKIKNREIQEALLKGQTIERKRVASELHDNVGSLLSAVRVSLLTLDSEKLPNQDLKIYRQIQQMVEDACKEVRLISHNLLPEELEKFGLEKALEKMIERLNFSTKIEFTLNTKGLKEVTLDKTASFHLYSICLELINNILKHAEATDGVITFRFNNNTLELFVRDNGKGIAVNLTQAQSKGKGLTIVEERVGAMGGIIDITSNEGTGTLTHISIPIIQPVYAALQT